MKSPSIAFAMARSGTLAEALASRLAKRHHETSSAGVSPAPTLSSGGTFGTVQRPADRLPSPLTLLRVGLAVFVLAWLFGPYTLQSAVPIWLPFLIAFGLELHFFVGALRPAPARRPDRGPQTADRERYGYGNDTEELLLVRAGGEEVWIPYSGETTSPT